jgi:hypothetical protein
MAQLSDTSLFNDANLVAYYKLSDVSDSKGSNTLTNNNTVTFVAGKYGNAADFGATNTNKSLTVASNLGINGNGAISISCWLNLYNTTGTQAFVFHSSTGGADRYLALNIISGELAFNAAGTFDSVPITTGVWHHVVVTRDGGGSVKGYIDNVEVVSLSAGGSGVAQNTFRISNDGSNFGNALIDDVPVFNDVLTADEVAILFAAGPGGGGAFLMNFV